MRALPLRGARHRGADAVHLALSHRIRPVLIASLIVLAALLSAYDLAQELVRAMIDAEEASDV